MGGWALAVANVHWPHSTQAGVFGGSPKVQIPPHLPKSPGKIKIYPVIDNRFQLKPTGKNIIYYFQQMEEYRPPSACSTQENPLLLMGRVGGQPFLACCRFDGKKCGDETTSKQHLEQDYPPPHFEDTEKYQR